MLILRRSHCIVTASGIVTVRKQPYSAPVESNLMNLFAAQASFVHNPVTGVCGMLRCYVTADCSCPRHQDRICLETDVIKYKCNFYRGHPIVFNDL